jgi:6-pyruvoyltetrahydropterin/6-carboxytetrahydropterin synthase
MMTLEEYFIEKRIRSVMRFRQYKFKFYLNARHAVYRKGVLGEVHPHTWELTINVMKNRAETVKFHELESQVEQFLDKYQDKVLNEVEPFDVINPTLENCCEYFREQLTPILNRDGWIFLMLELAGSSNMSYVISLIDDDHTQQMQTINSITDRIIKEIKEDTDG